MSSYRRFRISHYEVVVVLIALICATLGLILGTLVSSKADPPAAAQTITYSQKRNVVVTTTRTVKRNGKTLTVPVTTTQLVDRTVPITTIRTNTLVVNHNHTSTVTRTVTVPVTTTITVPTTIFSTVTTTVTTTVPTS